MPVGVARWARYDATATATIAGVECDVVSFQVDFELNAIPRAVVRLPVGLSTATGLPAPAHQVLGRLVEQAPITLTCQFARGDGSDPGLSDLGLPDGPFVLFEGVTAGASVVRSNAGVLQVEVRANGALVALTQGSIFSASSHPANPARYAFGAVTRSDSGAVAWTPLLNFAGSVTPGNLAADLWGQALYPIFRSLADQDGMWVIEKALKGDGTNAAAKAAVELLAPGGPPYVPLALRQPPDVDTAALISNDFALLAQETEALAHQTLWDLLVGGLAAEYAFAVVPRARGALVVPYLPGNRGPAHARLLAQDYVGVQLEAASLRPVRAYGLLAPLAFRSGFESPADGPAAQALGVGGWYDAKKAGSVLIQPGPRWLATPTSPAGFAPATLGAAGVVADAFSPAAAPATGAGAAAAARAAGVAKPLLDAMAQARYAQAVLQGRYGIVAGAFRVDVAPGSTVYVEGAGDAGIADADGLATPFYGEVLRVSLSLDAEARVAGTAFHVAYGRTEAENGDDATSVAAHPLYARAYAGAPLVDPA